MCPHDLDQAHHIPIHDIKAMMIEDGDIISTLVSTVKYSYQRKAGGC